MRLEKIVKKSKNGKEYTAYVLHVGLYESPMIFPSKIEENYIDLYLEKLAHEDFQGDDLAGVDENV